MAQAGNTTHAGRARSPRPVYVVDGARTPFLKFRGRPNAFSAADLGVAAGRQLLLRQPFEPDAVDQVIFGCAGPAAEEANVARVIALRLGCGHEVPAWHVQRNCGSGMQAVDAALHDIQDRRSELVLAGGTEAMSRAPLLFDERFVAWLADFQKASGPVAKARQLARLRPGWLKPVVALLRGLTDPVSGLSMGQTAENLAWRFGISRREMDEYAWHSHQRLAAAQDEGRLAEIEPLFGTDGHAHTADDGLRRESTVEDLGRLKPVFEKPFGKVTAGNSAQVTDGACALLLASEDAVRRWDLPVLARIVDSEWAGVDPAQMGLGPVHAVTPMLQRHRLALGSVDHWELNEAFAAQVLACTAAWRDRRYCREQLGLSKAWGAIDPQRLNVDGGGISLGHPVGTSGARITLHLAHVLRREGTRRGVATQCIGGGQGGAMLIENPEASA
ncbi:MAG: acetyl-CoA C-acetyltransferase [Halofilum sp. (in: g-proteobacteria)]|nr:acetyl-CoA C-acetyltransferase [Halofilum sp. (in: g-proteobacteria)]